MVYLIIQEEALRRDIKEYKELLWAIKDENTLLKVKNRRLEDILKKKNKIVDSHYLGTHVILIKSGYVMF